MWPGDNGCCRSDQTVESPPIGFHPVGMKSLTRLRLRVALLQSGASMFTQANG